VAAVDHAQDDDFVEGRSFPGRGRYHGLRHRNQLDETARYLVRHVYALAVRTVRVRTGPEDQRLVAHVDGLHDSQRLDVHHRHRSSIRVVHQGVSSRRRHDD